METVGEGRLVAGRYRLGAVIGRGGMGVVWRAYDELLSREVAVKELIWPAYLSEEDRRTARRRATREARLAARLSHRNVIRVFDIAEEDGCPWIVLELIPHRSLRDLVADEGPLGPSAAAEIGLQILSGLGAAHRQGIVHRDVKPANILIAPDRVVLTDFGIARATETSALTTATGELVGSPSYIPPERARGGESDARGDLWGLGASLYAAVEGRGPFDREGGPLASLLAVVADEPLPPAHAGPLEPVISGLLRKDPGQRLDAAEAERMLRAVAAPPAAAPSSATAADAVTARLRGSRGTAAALVGAAALAVLAVSGTALGLSSAGAPSRPAAAIGAGTGMTTPGAATPRAAAGTTAPAAAGHHPPAAATGRSTPAPRRAAARTIRVRVSPPSRSASAARNPGRGQSDTDNNSAGDLLAAQVGPLAAPNPSGAGHPAHPAHPAHPNQANQPHPGGP